MMGLLQVPPLRVRVNLGVMTTRKYFIFHKTLDLQPRSQLKLSVRPKISFNVRMWVLILCRGYSWRTLTLANWPRMSSYFSLF